MHTTNSLDSKTKQLISYLIDKHAVATVTSLVKLCYLADLVNFQSHNKQISKLEYIRWHYGPYDSKISDYLLSLVDDGTIKSDIAFTTDGNEYFKYSLKDKAYDRALLSEEETSAIDAVLNSLAGYGPSALVDVAYKTKPMKALGAKRGGVENLGVKLNLATK